MTKDTSSTDFEEWHLEKLTKNNESKLYLQIALDDYKADGNTAALLLAIRDVTKAQGGIQKLSERTGLNRQSLYKSLSTKGNPRLSTFGNILHGLGYKLTIEPLDKTQ